jgi:hypothetical protein
MDGQDLRNASSDSLLNGRRGIQTFEHQFVSDWQEIECFMEIFVDCSV